MTEQELNGQNNNTADQDTQNQTNPNVESSEVQNDSLAQNLEQDQTAAHQDLHQKIADLEKSLAEVQARANADMYNFQKRVERETDNAKKYALEKFSNGLLDVVDNLERAIAAAPEDSPFLEGVKLTHKSLLGTLEKFGVVVVNPEGEPFNAELQQAVGIDPTAPANQVSKVLQKGYTLNGRLLRPAMVMVGQ